MTGCDWKCDPGSSTAVFEPKAEKSLQILLDGSWKIVPFGVSGEDRSIIEPHLNRFMVSSHCSAFIYCMSVLYLNPHRTTTAQLSPEQKKHPNFHIIFSFHISPSSIYMRRISLSFFPPKLPSSCHLAVLPHGPDLRALHAECCLSRKSCKNQKIQFDLAAP